MTQPQQNQWSEDFEDCPSPEEVVDGMTPEERAEYEASFDDYDNSFDDPDWVEDEEDPE